METGRREGWIDGGQGAVDARAVAVGRYFRTVRSATKDGQAAEEREGVTLTGGRTGESCRPGSVKGGEGGFRTALPSAARRHRSRLSFSLSLSPSLFPPVRRHGRRRSRSLAGCRRASAAARRASERARAKRRRRRRKRRGQRRRRKSGLKKGRASERAVERTEQKFAHLGFITCP